MFVWPSLRSRAGRGLTCLRPRHAERQQPTQRAKLHRLSQLVWVGAPAFDFDGARSGGTLHQSGFHICRSCRAAAVHLRAPSIGSRLLCSQGGRHLRHLPHQRNHPEVVSRMDLHAAMRLAIADALYCVEGR